MKSEERLLTDVLRAGDYESFQDSVREAMVAEARAGRAARRARRWLAVAASVAVMGTALFWSRDGEKMAEEQSSAMRIVRTEAMPTGMVVRTERQLEVVRSAQNVAQFITAFERVAIITDEQLLNLFKDRPIALVRVGTDMRLVTPGDIDAMEQQ
jgi:hypothetical protein